MIRLNAVNCSFNTNRVLHNISLTIKDHLTILGANGSGKSTLAKIICNTIDYEGEVLYDKENIKDIPLKEMAKKIAYIPPKLESYETNISVEDFVLLGRFAHKKSLFDYNINDKKITKECLEFLHISHLASHYIGSLSSGETQLMLIAQALAQQTKIIIFDEPTANLDPKNSLITAKHIKALKENHHIILITHDLNLAHFIASPVAFIKDKKITLFQNDFFQDSTLEKLYGVSFKSLAVEYA
ncbi:ABC transporter ATP-binding protein [Sulfurimonas sp.]